MIKIDTIILFIYLEGCKSRQINKNELLNINSYQNLYELIYIKNKNRNLCKLNIIYTNLDDTKCYSI